MKARAAAEELAADLMNRSKLVPKNYSFKRFAQLFIDKGRRLVETGERNANYMRTARLFLDNDERAGPANLNSRISGFSA